MKFCINDLMQIYFFSPSDMRNAMRKNHDWLHNIYLNKFLTNLYNLLSI